MTHSLGEIVEGTNYILNCKNYKIDLTDNILKCVTCNETFIPLESGGQCTSVTGLDNCKIAKNSDYCSVCEDNYVLVQRQCEMKNIENCIEYQNDENSQI